MKRQKDYLPIQRRLNVIITEDDSDDLLLFEEAIEELPVSVQLKTFNNGDELMEWLTHKKKQAA